MSLGGRSAKGWGSQATVGILALIALGVLLAYVDRIFTAWPLYAADEGGYLIQALYGKTLLADPDRVSGFRDLGGGAFSLIIRALTYVTQNLLPWLRILGAGAYFGGLGLVFLTARGRLDRSQRLGFLLLALAFPYYRFVFTALPEGWYVGLIGLIVFATFRLYLSRPMAHALIAGALTGVLVMLKPDGVSVAAAFAVLGLLDLLCGRRDLATFASRLALFAAALLAMGALLTLASAQPITRPLSFFLTAHQAGALSGQITQADAIIGVRALALVTASSLLLAGTPLLTGLLRIEMRWRWSRGRERFSLEPQEVSFLLVLLSFGATLAMVTFVSMKALILGSDQVNRLWGRSFEFFVPMLWLTAAPFIAEFERAAGRWWRVVTGVITVAGVLGLTACLFGGIMVMPWDAGALQAFFRPDLAKFAYAPLISPFPIALVATLAACAAVALTAWPTHRIWLAYFVTLGLLSTWIDKAWEQSLRPQRAQMESELQVIKTILDQRPGRALILADDLGAHNLIILNLKARAYMTHARQGEAVAPARAATFDTIAYMGHHSIGGAWKLLFDGKVFKVAIPDPRPSAQASPGPSPAAGDSAGALGSGPRSG